MKLKGEVMGVFDRTFQGKHGPGRDVGARVLDAAAAEFVELRGEGYTVGQKIDAEVKVVGHYMGTARCDVVRTATPVAK